MGIISEAVSLERMLDQELFGKCCHWVFKAASMRGANSPVESTQKNRPRLELCSDGRMLKTPSGFNLSSN